MRQGLQYLYSFFVFFGVLATAYYMMNKDQNGPGFQRGLPLPYYRYEAGIAGTTGVNQLFQIENELSQVPTPDEPDVKARRTPTFSVTPKRSIQMK